MRWGTSRTILLLGAFTHGGFLLFMSHYTHSSTKTPENIPSQPQLRGMNERVSEREVETVASSLASATDNAMSVESDAMDTVLKSLGRPRGPSNTIATFRKDGHAKNLDSANVHSQTAKLAPVEVADVVSNSGGGLGSSSLFEKDRGLDKEGKGVRETPVAAAKKPTSKKKQLKDTLIDSWSGEPDLDDIIDPMVRRADNGELKDVVPIYCNTTKGSLEIEVFPESWGSRGAERFLALLDAGLFGTKVPLTRAVKGFIIQFGTPGDPTCTVGVEEFQGTIFDGDFITSGQTHLSKRHQGQFPSIKDDSQWMPIGPSCGAKRKGMKTCKRHRKGWLSFAGGGSNSRRIEMFVGLHDTGHGGPPHEVPFGRVLRQSFPVLDSLYTGYGEMASFGGHAPPSGRIAKDGIGFLASEFPLLDYVTSCARVKAKWAHPH